MNLNIITWVDVKLWILWLYFRTSRTYRNIYFLKDASFFVRVVLSKHNFDNYVADFKLNSDNIFQAFFQKIILFDILGLNCLCRFWFYRLSSRIYYLKKLLSKNIKILFDSRSSCYYLCCFHFFLIENILSKIIQNMCITLH